MATRVYGSWINNYGLRYRAWFDYTVTANNDTTYSVQIYPGVEAWDNTQIGVTFEATLSMTGKTTRSYERVISDVPSTATTYQFANAFTISWAKTQSAQSISIKLSVQNGPESTASVNLTISAKTSYSVKFNSIDDTTLISQTKWYNEALTLSTNRPTMDGYTFLGWATSRANAKAGTIDSNFDPGDTYSTNAALTLYATYELAYTPPTISNLKVERCDSDGTANDEGLYGKVTFDWSVYRSSSARYYGSTDSPPYASNGANATVTIPRTGKSTVTKTAALTFDGNGNPVQASIVMDTVTDPFDTDGQYAVTVSVEDTQTIKTPHSAETTGTLSTTSFPMDFNADATAMGIFRPAPDDKEGIFLGKDLYMPSELNLVDFFYPIGSFYHTTDANFNPANAWGGTWEKLGEGQVLISAGSNYHADGTVYGGNTKSYTPAGTVEGHAITIEEMPSHTHSFEYAQYNRGTGSSTASALQYTGATKTTSSRGSDKKHSHDFSGTQATLDVMQKSIAAYIWHRIPDPE